MAQKKALLRFYEELNSFLAPEKRKRPFVHHFWGTPSIKDVIESLGIPHTEIDLILINGHSVDFQQHLDDGDYVSVFPVFESLDISLVSQLREIPLRKVRFILDVHLGKLAKSLRMLGFDTHYRNDFADPEIVSLAISQHRVILTRDKGILKYKKVTHGYWVRSPDPKQQIKEILERFDLFAQIRPFHRCIACNGLIRSVSKESILSELKTKTSLYYNDFYMCNNCDRIYWRGSHFQHMLKQINYWLEIGLEKKNI